MKRFLSALICVAMLAGLMALPSQAATVSTGYKLPESVDAISLSADTAYTNPVRFTAEKPFFKNQQLVKNLQDMLSKAGPLKAKPKTYTEVARITTEVKGVKRSYILVKSSGSYYILRGTQCRSIAYEDFNVFIQHIESFFDQESKLYFYKYGNGFPRATSVLDGETCYWYGSPSQYKFRRLGGEFDGLMWEEDVQLVTYKTKSTAIPAITLAEQPDAPVIYSVHRGSDGAKLWSGTEAEAKSYRLDQKMEYIIKATTTYDKQYYRGDVVYQLYIDRGNNAQFSVEGGDTYLGEVIVLKVTGTTASDPLATFTSSISLNLPPKFHRQADGSQIALFPVSYRNTAGEHTITLKCGDKSATYSITAKDKKWQIQNLTVDSSTANSTINSQNANNEYERVIAPLRSVADDKQYWSGRFILPVSDKKVTTEFGMIRYVNGSPTSERHGALDLAVPRGTEVKATGGGRVLYSGFLQLTGNTVLIEHGYGLKSWYYHMDSLKVKTGDVIGQGKVIGTVGSTGFSTGPHLHFGMSVNNVFVNPYTLINTDLLV